MLVNMVMPDTQANHAFGLSHCNKKPSLKLGISMCSTGALEIEILAAERIILCRYSTQRAFHKLQEFLRQLEIDLIHFEGQRP